jgi:hypothetical protein
MNHQDMQEKLRRRVEEAAFPAALRGADRSTCMTGGCAALAHRLSSDAPPGRGGARYN